MKNTTRAALMMALLAGTTLSIQPAAAETNLGRHVKEAREQAQRDRRDNRQEHRQKAAPRQDRRDARPAARAENRGPRPDAGRRAEHAPPQQARHAPQRVEVRPDRHDERRDHRPSQARRVEPQHRDAQRQRQAQQVRRAEVERRLAQIARQRHDFRRPGEGRSLRDRDHGRSWYVASRYRPAYWSTQRYRVPTYRYPSGWFVRTWMFGDIMPASWYGPPYYLDWRRYGLPVPPIGAEWVRVRDDAVLVDTWSGRVLSVYYDLFW